MKELHAVRDCTVGSAAGIRVRFKAGVAREFSDSVAAVLMEDDRIGEVPVTKAPEAKPPVTKAGARPASK